MNVKLNGKNEGYIRMLCEKQGLNPCEMVNKILEGVSSRSGESWSYTPDEEELQEEWVEGVEYAKILYRDLGLTYEEAVLTYMEEWTKGLFALNCAYKEATDEQEHDNAE